MIALLVLASVARSVGVRSSTANLMLNGQGGAAGRRRVCLDYLDYNADGTMRPIEQTDAGVSVPSKR